MDNICSCVDRLHISCRFKKKCLVALSILMVIKVEGISPAGKTCDSTHMYRTAFLKNQL